jgi:hypothetical protein
MRFLVVGTGATGGYFGGRLLEAYDLDGAIESFAPAVSTNRNGSNGLASSAHLTNYWLNAQSVRLQTAD